MAMQVEVSSALPPLTNRSELTNEPKLQHPFASTLLDASNKPSERPSSLSPLILEERSKFGNPLRPATTPPVTSKPRLTPRPFSREKSSDTFAVVRPPVPALKPSNAASNPPTFAKTSKDVTVAKGLTGNIPPLVDQKLIENKSTGELVANMPFDSSPQANTVILFETGKPEKSRAKFTPEKSHLGSPQICSTTQAPEGQPPLSEPGVFIRRTAGIHRQLSFSSEARPVSWSPCVSLERQGYFPGASEEKGKVLERQHSAGIRLACEVQPRPKQRPGSAIFLESLKDPMHGCSEVSDEKSTPEKTWVRKPRPLSMDLTAKFESRELSLQRKSCPDENLSPDPTIQGSVRPSETRTKSEAVALERADASKSALKSPGPCAGFTSVLNQKPFPSEIASSCPSTQKDWAEVSARDRKCLWESRLKRQDEQNASDTEIRTASEKDTEPSKVKGRSVKDRAVLSATELAATRTNCTNVSDTENQSSREAGKHLDVLNRLATDAASVNVDPQLESPGKENRIVNIQQRIKELTAENAEMKPGNQRRSFRSRPLSADLTKLFSSPMTTSDLKPEKLAEVNRKPANEPHEIQEIKINPLHGTNSEEAHAGGVLWRAHQPIKIQPMQRDVSLARGKHSVTLQGGSPTSVAEHGTAAEKACIKTVRATVFEHNVQRHKVAADPFGAEPPSQLTHELVGNCRESWMGKATETRLHFSKEVPCRQLDMLAGAEKPGKANPFNGDKVLQDTAWKKYTTTEKCENPTPKHVEDSLVFQRVEPRYEILQTVGKRAQSEAVAVVCEDKAVTLRSRRSLKERRRPGGSSVAVPWSRSLDMEGECLEEGGFVSKMKEGGGTTVKAEALQTVNVSHDQHAFHKPVTETDKSHTGEKQETGKASCFTNGNKDLGTADGRVSMVSSELEKEKGKGQKEASKMPKHFLENFGAGPGGMDGGAAAADVSQVTASGNTSKLESPLSVSGGSQWQVVGSKVPCPSADLRTHEAEEPKVFGLRKCLTAHCAPDTLDAAGHVPEGDPFKQSETEEELKRSRHRVSAAKVSERWRRKTLPHDIRFDEAGTLAEEGVKMLIRRDSLQFHEGSIAKRSRKPRCVVEPKEGTVATPSSPEDHLRDQHSPLKPKATYFAVTYQIPSEAEGASGKEFAPKSKQISSQVENTLLTSNASTARRPHPVSDHQSCAANSDTPASLDRHPGKNRVAAEDGDTSDPLKKGAFEYPGSERREENWRSLKSQTDDAQERLTGAEVPLRSAMASSPCDLKPPSCLRHFHQDGEHSGQKKFSDYSYGAPKEKTTDNYRSRVLDIDALMAEYKEDSLKPSVIPDRREGEDGGWFPWEKYKRNSSDKTSFSYNRREPQAPNDSLGSPWQDISSVEVHGFEAVGVGERGRLQSCSPEQNSFKHRDGKFSPPPWGRPSAACFPADAAGTKKKTFILDEDPGASLELWCQGAKRGGYEGQVPDPIGLDLKAGASFIPPPSSVLADSILWKGTCSRQPVTNASLAGDWPNTSSLNKRKSSVAGSPQKSDSSALQSQPECNMSALSNARPDFKRSYSEKTHQARVRGSLPAGPEARERQDLHKARQSFPPERADHRQNRRSSSQQRSLFGDEKKDVEKERSGRDPESPGARSPPCLPLQRRSRSFYKDRRVDHWAVDQLKQCFGRPVAEAKDTDTLVREADSQYGTWREQRHSRDSLVPESPSSESNVASARKQPTSSRLSSFSSQTDPASMTDPHDSSRDPRSASLDRSSTDLDSAGSAEGPARACPEFSFLEHTTVLDSSILKTRVQLSKRRRQHRAPISHLLRRSSEVDAQPRLSVTEEAGSAWMFKDSTAPEEKSAKPEDSEEEGKLHPLPDRLPVSQPQRLPMFPGLDHSALKAELRRRQEPEGSREVSPVHISKSPKSTFPAGGPGGRMLPTGMEKEERLEEASLSPQWLKELKSKKRQSHYENQV
ncbi:uncharacterized protein KIAA1671 homolog isoform X1 [Eublepharis macularius]|uniref:Uncharacterized protein KIAA1671 homolog isoform X1 n=1 Tax=Eublepharis macularius TaxID=481883 RepID=A0AA97LED3_EUBMA|nr:uncharacterized protein KIAA1671 homolog isoform X1 [Eublepharis macularius]XP_054852017.1 uncharacterized protein KIAA1671 homolog isoform X1 [Eublepharis macularius]